MKKLLYQISPVGWSHSGYKMYDLATGDMLYNFTPKEEIGELAAGRPFQLACFQGQLQLQQFLQPFSPARQKTAAVAEPLPIFIRT